MTTTTSTKSTRNATILYPSATPTINNIDVLDLSYISNWKYVDLKLWCRTNAQTNAWAWYTANSIARNGTYILDPVQKKMNIPQFPVVCHFQLYDSNDHNDTMNAGQFSMVSIANAKVTTFSAVPSGTIVDGPTQTADSGGIGVSTGTSGVDDSSPVATSSPTSTPSSSSSGLSTGAAAGIGVGVAAGVLAIGCLVFFVYKRRKAKRSRAAVDLPSEADEGKPPDYQSGSGSYEKQAPGFKTHPTEIDGTHTRIHEAHDTSRPRQMAELPATTTM